MTRPSLNGSVLIAILAVALVLLGKRAIAQLARLSAEASGPPGAESASRAQHPALSDALVERLKLPKPETDVFVLTPAPAKEPVKVAPPPDPPTAPPFSYQYFGRVDQGERETYLQRGETLVLIRPGMMLEDGYEVVSVEEQLIVIRHKPTGQAVQISLPALRE